MISVLLDFIPFSQKNKTLRLAYKDRGGRRRKIVGYDTATQKRRTDLAWLLKPLDTVPQGWRFDVRVTLFPNEKKARVELLPTELPVGGVFGVADPDGILVTVMDALKQSRRIEDDSIRHVRCLEVVVQE